MKLLYSLLTGGSYVLAACEGDTPHTGLDGSCHKDDQFAFWTKSTWTDCNEGKRQRLLKTWECKPLADATEAPWIDCTFPDGSVLIKKEDCDDSWIEGDSKCVDVNSVFNADKGFCECKEGWHDSLNGCLAIKGENIISNVMEEMENRFEKLMDENNAYASDKLRKREKRIKSMLEKQTKVFTGKYGKSCSIKSRKFTQNLIEEVEKIKTETDRIKNLPETKEDHITAFGDAVKLMNKVLKLTIWNCRNSGYDSDTSDLSVDNGGKECPQLEFKMKYTKCRIQTRFHKVHNTVYLDVMGVLPPTKLFDVEITYANDKHNKKTCRR